MADLHADPWLFYVPITMGMEKAEVKQIVDYLKDLEEGLYEWDYRGLNTLGHLTKLYDLIQKLMDAKCTRDGVRIYKIRKWGTDTYSHKYVVDIVGDYPTMLLTLYADDNDAILKTYIYANGQVLAQHDGDYDAQR